MQWRDTTAAAGAGTVVAGLLSLVVGVVLALQPAHAAASGGTVQVNDAAFTWGISPQTNARSHNPTAINFLAAGVADPGRGGATLRKNQWKAIDGRVSVQKATAAGGWETATWEGLRTDAQGASIGVYGPFSGHRVHISDGSGTADAASDHAEVAWSGTFTVVYYGGNSVFTLTDPALSVRDGRGVLTATAGGWEADRVDTEVWTPVPSKRVVVTTLSDVDVTETGFRITPDYQGVEVTGSVEQVRTGDASGAFHQEFVSFLAPLGIDQFWYSTGIGSDRTKLPSELGIDWEAPTVVPPPPGPTDDPTGNPTPTTGPQPTDVPTPTAQPGPTAPPSPSETPTASPSPTTGPPPTGGPAPSPTQGPQPSDTPSPSDSPEPSEPPSEAPSGTLDVVDAAFTWGLSEQSNARSHNPAAINFLSAGVANPGRGGAVLPRRKWKATAGRVTVEKRTAAGAWKPATWGGLGTDAQGEAIGLLGPFSGHRVHISDGTGEVNPRADDASVAWKGTFTVVYYGGNTVFTLSDPRVELRRGKGTLTATAGGWASDRDDTDEWTPVESKRVTVTTLKGVDVTRAGFAVTPDYAGVKIKGSTPQATSTQGWGAFHQEFISFLSPLGIDQFWYSTGLNSDWTKAPTPVAVGWQGVEPRVPGPTDAPTPAPPEPSNPVIVPPATFPGGSLPTPTGAAAPPAPLTGPAAAPVALTGRTYRLAGQPTQVTATAAGETLRAAERSPVWWFAGGVLLVGAAVLLLFPTGRRRTP